jgi:hypothetical protein
MTIELTNEDLNVRQLIQGRLHCPIVPDDLPSRPVLDRHVQVGYSEGDGCLAARPAALVKRRWRRVNPSATNKARPMKATTTVVSTGTPTASSTPSMLSAQRQAPRR